MVGQFADGTLPRLEVLGRADDARVAAFGLDLLLDVSDFGPDLGESIARLLRSILGRWSSVGFALRHGRSPCPQECWETTIIAERS